MLRDAPTVSVLTIHHGPRRYLDRLKNALARQTYPLEKFTWVIIDDASPDDPPEWFDSPHTPFKIKAHRLKENVGRAKARNLALKHATGEIATFIDSDMEPVTVWLEMMVRAVKRSGGVIAGRYDPHPDIESDAFIRYVHSRGAHKYPSGARIPARYFTSGNSAFPLKLARKAGGFDEAFHGWGGEDLEFAIRLSRAGADFYFEPRAKAYHEHQLDWAGQEKRYREFGEQSVPLLLERHPSLEHLLSLSKLKVVPDKGVRLGLLHPFLLRLACSETVYRLVSGAVSRCRRFPWPAIMFDYLVFRQYSRAYARTL